MPRLQISLTPEARLIFEELQENTGKPLSALVKNHIDRTLIELRTYADAVKVISK